MMKSNPSSVEVEFFENLHRTKSPVTLYLINGVKLQGMVTKSDDYTLVLKREGSEQLVYKHAVATVVPHRN